RPAHRARVPTLAIPSDAAGCAQSSAASSIPGVPGGRPAGYHRWVSASLRIDEVTQDGHAALALDAGGPHVVVTTDLGPRVLSLTLPDGTGHGLFASLPELTIDTPGQPPFRMHGGHRLWAAPEVPA